MQVRDNKLDISGDLATKLATKYGTPLYVYELETIKERYQTLEQAISYQPAQIHFAVKANSNLEVLKQLRELGASAECVSPGEVERAKAAGFTTDRLVFTCSNIDASELAWLAEQGMAVNLDSLGQLEKWGSLGLGKEVGIRVNQGIGAGHHAHVITGGPASKFGIDISQLDEAKAIAKKHGLKIVGLHQHIGSNVLDVAILIHAMSVLLETARGFEGLKYLDFGGGLGVPYRPSEQPLDVAEFGKQASELMAKFTREYGSPVAMRLEPGRYLVAETGFLLTKVTDIKKNPDRTFVGVNTGFNHLIRPAMYGSYHQIMNASRVEGEQAVVYVAGNVCESGDLLAQERELTMPKEGEILAILNAGAYGYVMSSDYNLRDRPKEVVV